MNQKKSKPKPKQQPWNSFAYLAGLAKKKESVTIYLNSNTIEDETPLKGIIIDADDWTLAFLTNGSRKLLAFNYVARFIERLKTK